MTEFSAQNGAANSPTHHSVTEPEPRYTLAVPESWPHFDGPLHGLLAFQDGKCAVCSAEVEWGTEDFGTTVIATNSLRQWVEDGLLLGLVCYRCARRYKTLGKEPDGAAVAGLPRFLANPPGQRCEQTVGLGAQSRPRRFNSRLMPTEVPAPDTWSYSNTVIHSLFLWQRGRCAICSTGLSVATRPRYVHVDHDPASGLIRGLLCHRCNTCLGKDWRATWWEHNAATVDAYEEFPPAQICPATRGLTMAQRNRAAVVEWSADRQEILLDGMPMGVVTPPNPPHRPGSRWYALRYAVAAAPGLPPALQASFLLPYSDVEGRWLAFIMDPPATAASQERSCILRVKEADVLEVTDHASLEDALAAAFPSAA